MIEYKVWIHIEKCDEDRDIYEDIDGMPILAGTFDDEEEAIVYAEEISGKEW